MKKIKNWKHEKEFDTKTLVQDEIDNSNSEMIRNKSKMNDNDISGAKASPTGYEKSERTSPKTSSPVKKTKVYEPRPLTPDDDIYEDVLEHFVGSPTKPKYWFEEFGDYWSCSCGHINKGTHCKNCGLERELLRSLFILHKPADAPGKLSRKLKKSKEQIDKEERLHAERERRLQNMKDADINNIRPIEEAAEMESAKPALEKREDTAAGALVVRDIIGEDIEKDSRAKIARAFSSVSELASIAAKTMANEVNDEVAAEKAASKGSETSATDNDDATAAEKTGEADDKSGADTGAADVNRHADDDKQTDDKPGEAKQASDVKPDDASESPSQTANADTGNAAVSADNDKAQHERKSSKKKIIIIISVIIALLLMIGGGIAAYIYLAAPAMKYDDAKKLQADGKYMKAIAKYKALGDYKDSQEMIWKCYCSLGDKYFMDGQLEEALDTYYKAADLKDDDSLQDKINKTKFAYVEAHQSERTSQVETYMDELMKLDYPGIKKIYDSYYAWHVKIVANTSEDDFSTDVDTVSRSDVVYFHSLLSGGKPAEKIELYYEIIWPSGSSQIYALESQWQNGSKITARFQYPIPLFGREGTLTFKLYNKSTNEVMGTDSVTMRN